MPNLPAIAPELAHLATLIGVFGAGLYILNYFMLQLGVIRGNGVLYPMLVIVAASSVLFSTIQEFNLASSIIQTSYICISVMGLLRGYLAHHLVRFSQPERDFISHHLATLKPLQARKLLDAATVVHFDAGQTLINEGHTTDFLAFVQSGRTTILKDGQEINQCGADEFLGELTFGLGLPATATVRADRPTCCLVFDSKTLMRLLRRNRHIDDALKAALFRHARQKLLRSNSRTVQAKGKSAAA